MSSSWVLVTATLLWTGLLPMARGQADSIPIPDRPGAKPLQLPADERSDNSARPFVLPTVPEAPSGSLDGSQSIAIKKIELHGNTVLSAGELRVLVEPYEGRTVNLDALEALRQALTRRYIDRGYINSGAVIREDAYQNGTLVITLIEGRLDDVQVTGTERLRPGYVRNRLWPSRHQVFNVNKLEDRYQRLLSDPLIARMNGQLLPGRDNGHAILAVDVARARPYQLTLFGNNYRPPSIGGEAFGLTGVVRNLTGLGDALDFTYVTSGGSSRYAGGWSLPLTDAGTEFIFRFDEGQSAVIEEPVRSADIRSDVHSLEGSVTHPVINRLNERLTLGVSFGIRANDTAIGSVPFSFDRPQDATGKTQATVLRFVQDYSHRWDRQLVALRSTFSFGVNALGATVETDPNLPDSEFFAWLGQTQFAYRLPDNRTQLVLRGNLQLSDDPLLPLERIAVGGVGTVRGYRENYLVRDQGYTGTAEVHYQVGGLEPIQLTLIPFFDFGEAWNHLPGSSKATLCSLGVGLDARYKAFHAEFYYGHAFTNPLPNQERDIQDDGIHFQARIDLF